MTSISSRDKQDKDKESRKKSLLQVDPEVEKMLTPLGLAKMVGIIITPGSSIINTIRERRARDFLEESPVQAYGRSIMFEGLKAAIYTGMVLGAHYYVTN